MQRDMFGAGACCAEVIKFVIAVGTAGRGAELIEGRLESPRGAAERASSVELLSCSAGDTGDRAFIPVRCHNNESVTNFRYPLPKPQMEVGGRLT